MRTAGLILAALLLLSSAPFINVQWVNDDRGDATAGSLTLIGGSGGVVLDEKVSGVTVYEAAGYQGPHWSLLNSDGNLCDNALSAKAEPLSPCFSGPSWNDVISSIRIEPGYRALLYIDSDIENNQSQYPAPLIVTGDLPDLRQVVTFNGAPWDDNVSRIVVQQCEPTLAFTLISGQICRILLSR